MAQMINRSDNLKAELPMKMCLKTVAIAYLKTCSQPPEQWGWICKQTFISDVNGSNSAVIGEKSPRLGGRSDGGS